MKPTSALLALAVGAILFSACTPAETPPEKGTVPETSGVVSTGPLPDGAYKASITIVNPPQTMTAGQQVALQVKIKNLGDGTWPSTGQGSKFKVDAGNHWLDKNGKMVLMDDGRAGLPRDLKPGEEAELMLTVKAPKTAGDYILEVDMVHEDVLWFGSKGSQTSKTNVKIQ